MKYLLTFLSFVFCINVLFAQPVSNVATFSTEQPKIGEQIAVTYNPAASGALLKDAKEITALCLVYRGEDNPLVMDSPMKQEGGTWKAEFTLADNNAKHLAFQFVSGETYDDNSRDCWVFLVYGSDNKPVMGAHYSLASVFQNGGSFFGENQNPDRAKEEITKELELYPNNPDALVLYVRQHADAEKTPETTEKLFDILNNVAGMYKENEEKLSGLTFLYSMIGKAEKAKEIENACVEKNPKGYIAMKHELRPYYSEQNTDKAAEIVSAAFGNFPNMDDKTKQSLTDNLTYRYANEKQFDKAEQWLLKAPKPSNVYYNYVAKMMVESDANFEKAAELAQKAVSLNKNINPAEKPSYMTKSEWESSNNSRLAGSLGTYGYALLKQNKFSDAEPVLEEAYQANKGTSPDINQRYVFAMVKNKHYDKAITTGLSCIKNLQDNAKLLDDVKDAYIGRDGSDNKYSEVSNAKKQAFEDAVTNAGKEHAEEITKKIKNERTSKPSIDFTLNDMNGNPVTLSSLKGKVVIVDFWATWCGPCKQSFPYLQYMYEQYQNNENVKIFAINTWERIKGADAILENTKKFMQTNKYTFPVLMDNDAVTQYGVEGIPTKFIIDKQGNIAYTSIGFEGPQMVEEMKQEIEMLLKE